MVKRKERDEEVEPGPSETAPTQGSTLFVSNLPYTATSVDLQTLFSDIAPVRSAFVVLDKESRKSKGVGYVSFAVKEDAALAAAQIEKDGLVLDRRSLRVQFADRKPPDTEDGVPAPKVKKPRQPRAINPSAPPADPLAIRTVVISGLPSSIDSKSLWKKVRKLPDAEKIIQWPVKSAEGEEDPTTGHALFASPAAAQTAVTRLHAHVFKGALLSVALKKRLDTRGAPTRGSRLIVRNLPWHTTEHELRRLFLPYGPIHSITLPTKPSDLEGGAPRAKGFAFVWMVSRPDAERAIEGTNGTTVGSGEGGRVVAVDWALSKERWEEERDKTEDRAEGDEGADSGSGSGSEDDNSGSEDGSSGSEDDHVGVNESGDDEDRSEEDDEDPPERPQLPPPETGTTLFIRNVPFDATEDELRTLFRAFGPLRYARITMDVATGRSRGTGFVCFWDKANADRAIQQAELLQAETGGAQNAPIKKNPFTLLTPDPSTSLAHSLVLHGRTLDVTRAVTREEAGRLRELGEKQREKQDKRNMYLMREGVIFPDTPAAETLSAAELERRVQAFNTRRALLRSNPSLYVSKTRLSVRQLPVFATERTLKRLAIHAVRTFEEEVKNGARAALSNDEVGNNAPIDGEEEPPKKRRKRGERATPVRQAKIVRQADRVDPLTGKGRSKGYGFLELTEHADALRVLRWANNNPDVSRLMRTWWAEELRDISQKLGDGGKSEDEQARRRRIKDNLHELEEGTGGGEKQGRTLVLEFSIENVQVVRRRQEREDGDPKLKRKGRDPAPVEEETPPAKKKRIVKDPPKVSPTDKKLGGLIGRKRKEKRAKAR